MPVPKKRTSHSRTHTRRAHHALSPAYSIVCPKCSETTQRHRACSTCGTYRGRVIDTKAAKAHEAQA